MKRIKIKILHLTLVMAFLMPLFDAVVMAQAENKFIRRGNKDFEKGNFKEAEIDYQSALERNAGSAVGEFNLGGAIYEQENFEESATIFDNLSRRSLPDEKRAKSFHNLGNSLINLQQYQHAIEAYKNALRINPDDLDSKYNLLYAQQMLQEQQQQSEDQQQDDQQDDQEQQDQEQQADNQQQDDQQQDQQDQQQAQDNQQQQAQDQARQLSSEDAERMLQALQERERETLEKLKMEQFKSAKRVQSEKDW